MSAKLTQSRVGVANCLQKTYASVMGEYDKHGNYQNSPKDKFWLFVIIAVVLVTAFIAGSDGGGYSIPSNEP